MVEPTALVILAGGRSTRMGRDKALLPTHNGTQPTNQTQLTRLAALASATAQATGRRVFISGRERPSDWSLPDILFVPDLQNDQGPLGGIVTLLAQVDNFLCLACDLFALEKSGLEFLLAQTRPDGFVLVHDGQIEPLCAQYTQAQAASARERLNRGERALHRLVTACAMPQVHAPAWLIPQLANINTPEEWQRFSAL
jgi:molybdenum cofactor guanylyltransferase